jgi:hypothetical protein
VGALAGMLVLGCSSVQIAKRDECWVRHTKSFPNSVKEEIGVCSRAPPVWSKDRVTRLVQECMVEADFRWKNRALDAWNRGQPLPPERPERAVMQACMNDAATSLVRENEALSKRIAELTHERDGLLTRTDQDHQDLRESQTRMTQALGEAAKRPAPNAFALATSSGQADTRSTPAAPAQVVVPSPVVVPTVVVPPGAGPASGVAQAEARKADAPQGGAPAGGLARGAGPMGVGGSGGPLAAPVTSPKTSPKRTVHRAKPAVRKAAPPPPACTPPVSPAADTTARRAPPTQAPTGPALKPAVK